MDEQRMQQIEETMGRYRAAFDEHRAADERASTSAEQLDAIGAELRGLLEPEHGEGAE